MDADAARRWSPPPTIVRYDARRTILYALGVGAGRDPDDLAYVHEDRLIALPTLATTLGGKGAWFADPDAGIDLARIVHAEQALDVHRPLAAAAALTCRAAVEGLRHRGAGRGSLMVASQALADAATGEAVAAVRGAFLLRGDDGPGPGDDVRPLAPDPVPDRAPDARHLFATRLEQAALYRLSGDTNALHIVPEAARLAGFDRPILHGLCSYGIAARSVAGALFAGVVERLTHLSCRFTAPLFPGETLATSVWRTGDREAAFQGVVAGRGTIVLDRGKARWR